MVADAATKSTDGKLYVHGGGWNSLFTVSVPATHPVLALVLTFKLSWHESHKDLPFVVELLDEDDQLVGLRGEGKLRMAAGPFQKLGSDIYDSFTQTFYNLTFEKYGQYRFRISSEDKELASIPIVVAQPPGV